MNKSSIIFSPLQNCFENISLKAIFLNKAFLISLPNLSCFGSSNGKSCQNDSNLIAPEFD